MLKGLAMIVGCVAFNSGMMLLGYPGGGGVRGLIANIRKLEFGVWVFIVADISAFFISMAVLIVAMTVGPAFWERNKKRVGIPMFTALVAMVIAIRHIVLVRSGGNDLLFKIVVNGSSIVFMSFVCFVIYILWSDSRKNQVEAAGPVAVVNDQ